MAVKVETPTAETLAIAMLRDGRIDCDLATGEVFTIRDGVPYAKAMTPDKDGYLTIMVQRSRGKGNGNPDKWGRFRDVRNVRVNRLVKIKAMAVAKGGRNWRSFVAPLPRGADVNHIDTNRENNASDNLELSTERANRGRREMTEEELAELQAAGW